MKSSNSFLLIILFAISALVLVACGGEDSNDADDAPLPTIAPTLDTSSSDASNAEAGNTETGPPVDGGESPVDQVEPNQVMEVVTDFSTLTVNDAAFVSGVVSVATDEASGESFAILTDEQGNELRLTGFPIQILEGQIGETTRVEGVVTEPVEGDTRLVLEISGPGFGGSPTVGGEGNDALPPGISDSGTGDPPLSFDATGPTELTTLSVQLGENLTALQAYDELFLNLSADLLGAELLEIVGTAAEGWRLQFFIAEKDATIFYFVQPDGTVQQSTLGTPGDIPGAALLPIDRSRVVVDSDVASNILSEANTGPVFSIALRATEAGGIEWQLNGFPGAPVDATVAPQS